jgi:flavodoxin
MKILIAYGTKYGSTRSIAERIQERIAAANVGEVVLLPFDDKLSVNDYGKS